MDSSIWFENQLLLNYFLWQVWRELIVFEKDGNLFAGVSSKPF